VKIKKLKNININFIYMYKYKCKKKSNAIRRDNMTLIDGMRMQLFYVTVTVQNIYTKGMGTVGSIAPEALLGGLDVPHDGAMADIWSAGKSVALRIAGKLEGPEPTLSEYVSCCHQLLQCLHMAV
jgi:hypothetical protein